MLNKTNLLEFDGEKRVFPSKPLQITPNEENQVIVNQTAINLLPNKVYSNSCMDTDQEILFFISGSGEFELNNFTEAVEQGDRITVNKKQTYNIYNKGNEPLYFLSTGINLDK